MIGSNMGCVKDATDSYFEAEDAIALWIAECCRAPVYGNCESTILYQCWRNWGITLGVPPPWHEPEYERS